MYICIHVRVWVHILGDPQCSAEERNNNNHHHSEGNEKCHHHHSEINVNPATVREMRNIVITITVRDTRNVINVTSKVISVKAAVFFFIIFRKNSSSEIRLYSLKLSVSQFYRAVKTEDAQTQASTAAVYFREKRQKRTK